MVTKNIENKIEEKKATMTRPPIVVVLGHVDHGKSSLLEAIREDFKITSKEAGGITQHIGAYEAEYHDKKITFIDTPGHELFSQMRSRGAKVADIAILVVAADESVKPQTIEAIEQIKKAKIPMAVAINKIDKPEANVERVKQDLAQHDVMVESFGGKVPAVETSAVTKKGIEDLLEMILLMAELEDLQADFGRSGEGVVIEALLDSKRGPTATLLVTNGVVRAGELIGTKSANGKVRILEDFQGGAIDQATASMPVVMIGFENVPRVGEEWHIFSSEELMRSFLSLENKEQKISQVSVVDSDMKVLNLVLKADVSGSLEAIENVVSSLPHDEVVVRVIRADVGEIGENDVKFARSTNARIFGFRTKVSAAATDLAEKEKIQIETFDIIYELIQRIREFMEESVEDEGGREDIGALHILGVFLVDKKRQVVGGKVTEGEVRKGIRAEIIRAEEIVGEGRITNVQRDKKDVLSVAKGQECGLSFEGTELIQEGDTLQFYIERPPKKS